MPSSQVHPEDCANTAVSPFDDLPGGISCKDDEEAEGKDKKDELNKDNEEEELKQEEHSEEEVVQRPRRGSVILIDTGKRIEINEAGEEIVSELPVYSPPFQEFDSEVSDSNDDGTSFLSPVAPISPLSPAGVHEMPQIQSAVKVIEDGSMTFRPRRVSLANSRRLSSTASSLETIPVPTNQSEPNEREGSDEGQVSNGVTSGGFHSVVSGSGSQVFLGGVVNYGNGSQLFGEKRPGRERALSFADEKGLDINKVHETFDTHYKVKKRSVTGTFLLAALFMVAIFVLVPVVVFLT